MIRCALMRLLCLLIFCALAAGAAPVQKLFDGKSLKGWKQCNGNAVYKAEKGVIVGTTAEGSPNSFLCTEKTFGDFVLEYEIWADDVLNSGMQIRSHQYATEQRVRTFNGKEGEWRTQPGRGVCMGIRWRRE